MGLPGDIMWRYLLIVFAMAVAGGVFFLTGSFAWRMVRTAVRSIANRTGRRAAPRRYRKG